MPPQNITLITCPSSSPMSRYGKGNIAVGGTGRMDGWVCQYDSSL